MRMQNAREMKVLLGILVRRKQWRVCVCNSPARETEENVGDVAVSTGKRCGYDGR
jgi:hypothetical protein